VPTW
jgi:hypothetical protein